MTLEVNRSRSTMPMQKKVNLVRLHPLSLSSLYLRPDKSSCRRFKNRSKELLLAEYYIGAQLTQELRKLFLGCVVLPQATVPWPLVVGIVSLWIYNRLCSRTNSPFLRRQYRRRPAGGDQLGQSFECQ